MEYLGFWVTRDGVKPINKEKEAINNMKPPTSWKEVRKFIGVVNYWWHKLVPLTRLIYIKRKFKLTQVEQDDFYKIKWFAARDTLLTYPDFNETFKIHTGANTFQLGAVVVQKGKLIAFYSIQLTYSQQQYTVTERELLSIVEILKEFRTILIGQKLRIYTDH